MEAAGVTGCVTCIVLGSERQPRALSLILLKLDSSGSNAESTHPEGRQRDDKTVLCPVCLKSQAIPTLRMLCDSDSFTCMVRFN